MLNQSLGLDVGTTGAAVLVSPPRTLRAAFFWRPVGERGISIWCVLPSGRLTTAEAVGLHLDEVALHLAAWLPALGAQRCDAAVEAAVVGKGALASLIVSRNGGVFAAHLAPLARAGGSDILWPTAADWRGKILPKVPSAEVKTASLRQIPLYLIGLKDALEVISEASNTKPTSLHHVTDAAGIALWRLRHGHEPTRQDIRRASRSGLRRLGAEDAGSKPAAADPGAKAAHRKGAPKLGRRRS